MVRNFPGVEIDGLLRDAEAAMSQRGPRYWHCQKSVSIAYFLSHLNEIRAELRAAKPLPVVDPANDNRTF